MSSQIMVTLEQEEAETLLLPEGHGRDDWDYHHLRGNAHRKITVALDSSDPSDRDRGLDGAALIVAERRRQEQVEDWTLEHDDQHTDGELAKAACAYALPNDPTKISNLAGTVDLDVPRRAFMPSSWDFKPGDRIRELTKAGALIAAEIDRLQRLAAPTSSQEGTEGERDER